VDFMPRPTASVFKPPHFSGIPEPFGLANFKVSQIWSRGLKSARTTRIVPYIDRKGLIHATACCTWTSTAPQIFATILSTVYKRLWGRFSHYEYRARPKPNDLFKIALLYTITNDDYWYLRAYEICIRSRPVLKHLYRKYKQLDDNTKVLYDQALKNALWFQSRIRKPNHVSCPNTFVVCDRRKIFCSQGALLSSVTDYSINLTMKVWGSIYTPSLQTS